MILTVDVERVIVDVVVELAVAMLKQEHCADTLDADANDDSDVCADNADCAETDASDDCDVS